MLLSLILIMIVLIIMLIAMINVFQPKDEIFKSMNSCYLSVSSRNNFLN